jgi:hypothetical protein
MRSKERHTAEPDCLIPFWIKSLLLYLYGQFWSDIQKNLNKLKRFLLTFGYCMRYSMPVRLIEEPEHVSTPGNGLPKMLTRNPRMGSQECCEGSSNRSYTAAGQAGRLGTTRMSIWSNGFRQRAPVFTPTSHVYASVPSVLILYTKVLVCQSAVVSGAVEAL